MSFHHSSTLVHFPDLIADALRKRLHPNTALHVEQLAFTIRVSKKTIHNLLNANRSPRGDTLLKLLDFFDAAFANEILGHTGCTVVKLSDHREQADAVKEYIEAQQKVLRLLGTGSDDT